MVKEGHAIALHGVTHQIKKVYASPYHTVEELHDNQKIIEGITQ